MDTPTKVIPVYGYDFGPRGNLHWSSLLRIGQRLAHEYLSGINNCTTTDSVWVVRRHELRVVKQIDFCEKVETCLDVKSIGSHWIELSTDVKSPNGGNSVLDTSWLLINRITGHPLRIPHSLTDHISASFGTLAPSTWRRIKMVKQSNFQSVKTVSLRDADFDLLGHVNNATFPDIIQWPTTLSSAHIEYVSEIPASVDEICISLESDETRSLFQLSDINGGETTFAFGSYTFPEKR